MLTSVDAVTGMPTSTPETLNGNMCGPRARPSVGPVQSHAVDRSTAALLMAEVRPAALIFNIGSSGNAVGAACQLQEKQSFEKRPFQKPAIAYRSRREPKNLKREVNCVRQWLQSQGVWRLAGFDRFGPSVHHYPGRHRGRSVQLTEPSLMIRWWCSFANCLKPWATGPEILPAV